MFYIMVHAHAADLDASLAFYRHLRFVVNADDSDGEKTRCLRLTNQYVPGMLLNLKNAPHLPGVPPIDPNLPPPRWPVTLALVVDDYIGWLRRLEEAHIELESKVIEPWGVWLHFRDPSGNRLCITTNDLY
jgi:predicted enzyme related to lactoylglutathione lyase